MEIEDSNNQTLTDDYNCYDNDNDGDVGDVYDGSDDCGDITARQYKTQTSQSIAKSLPISMPVLQGGRSVEHEEYDDVSKKNICYKCFGDC